MYAILTDTDQRAVYDESGSVQAEDYSTAQDWAQYWRLLFSKISVQDIKSFEESYKGSVEELETLKCVYCESEGDMDVILAEVGGPSGSVLNT